MKIRYRIDQEFVRLFMKIQLVVEKSCSVVLQPLKAFNGFRGEYGLKKIFKWFLKASENFLKLFECACVALYICVWIGSCIISKNGKENVVQIGYQKFTTIYSSFMKYTSIYTYC